MKFLCFIDHGETNIKSPDEMEKSSRKTKAFAGTLKLRHHVGQVVFQFGVSGELETHVIVSDSSKYLWRIDAPLVQDAIDAKSCDGKRK